MTTLPALTTAADDFDARVPELEAALVVRAYETAQVLRAMRDETPKLPTLTIVDVLYDIVRAIRNRDTGKA